MRIPTKPLVLFGLVLFAYIVWITGPSKIFSALLAIDVRFLLVSLLFPIPVTLLKAYRWKIIVSYLKIKISLFESTKVWLIGLSASTVTPSKAGDVIRGFYLNDKFKLHFGKAISSVVVDRIFDVISMAALAVLGVFILLFLFKLQFSTYIFIFVFFVLVTPLIFITNKRIVKVMLRPIFRFLIPQKYKEKLKLSFDQFYVGLRVFTNKKRLAYLFFISLLSWSLTFIEAYFIFLALNVNIPLLFLFAVLPIEILVSLIPITISGFGTREFTLILFFSLIGIVPEVVVSFSLLSVLYVWITAAVGFILWLRNPIEIKI